MISILTPYPIPTAWKARKVPNIGDGFILRAVERLLGSGSRHPTYSPRVPPSPTVEQAFAASDLVVMAGANQLNDGYTIWPGLTADQIRSRGYRLLPFGIGLHGEAHVARSMSAATRDILLAVHETISVSSWRCPLTMAYLEAALPELKGRLLMTGCPVLFDDPLLRERRFHAGADHVAVTITERGENWFERERSTLEAVARRFPQARRTLVLHQDFARLADPAKPRPLDGMMSEIKDVAEALGYAVYVPIDADDAIGYYRSVDMHFGSRVHAHLLMLSLNKKSFVTAFDDRTRGLALAFGFPIFRPDHIEDALAFDFERVRQRALVVHDTMRRFLDSVAVRGAAQDRAARA